MLNKIIHNSTVNFNFRIINILIIILFQSILARTLGPELRGEFAVCFTFLNFILILFSLGSDYSFTYFVSKDNVPDAFFWMILFSTLSFIISLPFTYFLPRIDLEFFRKTSISNFYILNLIMPFAFFWQNLIGYILGKRDFFLWNISQCVLNMSILIAYSLLIIYVATSVKIALFAILFGYLFSITIIVSYLHKRAKFSSFSLRIPAKFIDFLNMLKYGLKLLIGRVTLVLNFQVGTIIGAFYLTTGELGVFSVILSVIYKLFTLPDAFIQTLIPYSASSKDGTAKEMIYCMHIIGILMFLILILVALLAKIIIVVLFSEKYLIGLRTFLVMLLGVFFRLPAKLFSPYFLGTNRPELSSLITSLTFISLILLMIFLIPHYGIVGAGIAHSLAFLVETIATVAIFSKLTGFGLNYILIPRPFKLLSAGLKFLKQ